MPSSSTQALNFSDLAGEELENLIAKRILTKMDQDPLIHLSQQDSK